MYSAQNVEIVHTDKVTINRRFTVNYAIVHSVYKHRQT